MQIITLTTDFGLNDWYVGCMKGVILSINSQVSLIDICHTIPAQNIHSAGLVISNATPYFPPNTIHLVIVDPGVGSDRLPVIVKLSNSQIYVLPNNGLLSALLQKTTVEEAYVIENPRYFRQNISQTFHGRDIFAPVCGYISLGVGLHEFGKSLHELKMIEFSKISYENKEIIGEIVIVDFFGNLISNISNAEIGERQINHVKIGNNTINKIGKKYCDGEPGEILMIFSSEGFVEICVNQGNAQQILNAGIGTKISILFD